jgi:hypothetical protein
MARVGEVLVRAREATVRVGLDIFRRGTKRGNVDTCVRAKALESETGSKVGPPEDPARGWGEKEVSEIGEIGSFYLHCPSPTLLISLSVYYTVHLVRYHARSIIKRGTTEKAVFFNPNPFFWCWI